MRGEQIREMLKRGQRIYGTHVCSLTNPVTAKMETAVEMDFAFICNEHMPIDRTETSMMCQFYAAHGIVPVVRVPNSDPIWTAMALDAGAQGITVPYVEEIDEVRAAVGAVKYRPIKGRFLRELLDGSRQPTEKSKAFLNRFNRDHFLIIGVESVAAIENLEALISVPGVDGVFLGPHDISVSMELPEEYDHPDFVATIEDVIRRCRASGVGVGLHTQLPNLPDASLKRFLDAGMNWLANGSDITTTRQTLNEQFAGLRKMCGDTFQRDGDHDLQVSSCIG